LLSGDKGFAKSCVAVWRQSGRPVWQYDPTRYTQFRDLFFSQKFMEQKASEPDLRKKRKLESDDDEEEEEERPYKRAKLNPLEGKINPSPETKAPQTQNNILQRVLGKFISMFNHPG